jgi:spermidine synthase
MVAPTGEGQEVHMGDVQSAGKRIGGAFPYSVVFLTSMGVMIVELAASRLISKYFGTSLYTWTTVIGVILGGISLGNYIGGRLADRHPPYELAGVLLLIASVAVFVVLLLDPVLGAILQGVGSSVVTAGMVIRAVLAITFLFLLPSTALGAVSPAMAKHVLQSSSRIGSAVGKVYALGSVGSIVGTFLSGFVLIPLLGVRSIVLVVGGTVGVLSLLMSRRKLPVAIWLVLMVAAYVLLTLGGRAATTLYAAYSPYSYIEIRDKVEAGRPERVLIMDGLIHNRYDPTRPDDLLYDYEQIFAAVTRHHAGRKPGSLDTLTLGGGAFLFPVYLERHYPGVHEVAELDPEVVRNARRFFDLPLDTAIRISVTDARNFVNWAQGRRTYDIAFMDAFNSYSVPAHLTTREFVRSLSALLDPDGLLVSNVIDVFSIGRFLGAFVRTLSNVFPYVTVYEKPGSSRDLRNTFVVVATGSAEQPGSLADPSGRVVATRIAEADLQELASRTSSTALTDDHAPVENLMAPVFLRSVRKDVRPSGA